MFHCFVKVVLGDELRPLYVGLIISHDKDFPQERDVVFARGPIWSEIGTGSEKKTVFVCQNRWKMADGDVYSLWFLSDF